MDKRTADRLRRGDMAIDARLDLHGKTQAAAQRVLKNFILDSHAAGWRCLLVITGKGQRKSGEDGAWYETRPGILRTAVPDWLQEPDLAPLVLRVLPAQGKHGGDGALYVLLRRRRGS